MTTDEKVVGKERCESPVEAPFDLSPLIGQSDLSLISGKLPLIFLFTKSAHFQRRGGIQYLGLTANLSLVKSVTYAMAGIALRPRLLVSVAFWFIPFMADLVLGQDQVSTCPFSFCQAFKFPPQQQAGRYDIVSVVPTLAFFRINEYLSCSGPITRVHAN
jgi:hypothetical protein